MTAISFPAYVGLSYLNLIFADTLALLPAVQLALPNPKTDVEQEDAAADLFGFIKVVSAIGAVAAYLPEVFKK